MVLIPFDGISRSEKRFISVSGVDLLMIFETAYASNKFATLDAGITCGSTFASGGISLFFL